MCATFIHVLPEGKFPNDPDSSASVSRRFFLSYLPAPFMDRLSLLHHSLPSIYKCLLSPPPHHNTSLSTRAVSHISPCLNRSTWRGEAQTQPHHRSWRCFRAATQPWSVRVFWSGSLERPLNYTYSSLALKASHPSRCRWTMNFVLFICALKRTPLLFDAMQRWLGQLRRHS